MIFRADEEQTQTIASILSTLFKAPAITFPIIAELTGPTVFSQLFASNSEPLCLLALELIEKAAQHPEHVALLAGWPDTVKEILLHWLTSSTTIAGKAEETLVSLLERDSRTNGGKSKLWSLLLTDQGTYETILKVISWDGPKLPMSKGTRSTAQGRLLSLLKKLAEVDFAAITSPTLPDVVKEYFPDTTESGLAGVAVDAAWVDDDLLMLLTLFEFGTTIISAKRKAPGNGNLSSDAIAFLSRPDVRLHQEILGTYSWPENQIDSDLQSAAVDYLVEFCRREPQAFYKTALFFETNAPRRVYLSEEEFWNSEGRTARYSKANLPDHLFARIEQQLHKLNPEQSMNALKLLTSIPIQFALPSEAYPNSLVTKIPFKPLTAPALQTLAYYFNPPNASPLGKVFYAYYLRFLKRTGVISDVSEFFQIISKAIDNFVNLEVAIAALNLLGAFTASKWDEDPPEPFTNDDIHRLMVSCPEIRPQRTGLLELVSLTTPLTSLLNIPPQFANSSVRPGPNDPIWPSDDDAVKLAKMKYALIKKTAQRLGESTDVETMSWKTAFDRRVARGVMGGQAPQMATMGR